MNNKEFKNLFNKLAKQYGFKAISNNWFRESDECIVGINLQKSYYCNLYYLNINIFVHGIFGNHDIKEKDLMIKGTNSFSERSPKEYDDVFSLEMQMDDKERTQRLESFFAEYLGPLVEKALTRNGIKELVHANQISVFPSAKEELNEKFQLGV